MCGGSRSGRGRAGRKRRPQVAPSRVQRILVCQPGRQEGGEPACLRDARHRLGVLRAAMCRQLAGSVDWPGLVAVAKEAEPPCPAPKERLCGQSVGGDPIALVGAADAEVSAIAAAAQQDRRDRWDEFCNDQWAAGGGGLFGMTRCLPRRPRPEHGCIIA